MTLPLAPPVSRHCGAAARSRGPCQRRFERQQITADEGIDVQILSLTSPGVQSIDDPEHAAKSAKETNDSLAEMVSKAPTRFDKCAARSASRSRR